MIENIVLLDITENEVLNYYPFSVLHPFYELRTGVFKIFQKFQVLFPSTPLIFKANPIKLSSFLKRSDIKDLSKQSYTNCLVWKSSYIFDNSVKKTIELYIAQNLSQRIDFVSQNGEKIASFFPTISDKEVNNVYSENTLDVISITLPEIQKISHIWEVLDLVGKNIAEEKNLINLSNHKYYGDAVFTVNTDNIVFGENVIVEPMVMLNAKDGPIIIDSSAKIMSNSVIYGPCYIGKNVTIKAGAKIYQNTSIGEYCKVGGEVENSVFQAYSNKQHEGFLGHSFISEWVNLGADTNNSDLKNTYSEISIQLPHKLVKTGKIFLGLICGDHTKSGINTMFTTGTVSGIAGILVKDWFLPNYIKSFSWGGKTNSPIYKVEKAIETAKIVKQRRNRTLLPEEEELIRLEYQRVLSE